MSSSFGCVLHSLLDGVATILDFGHTLREPTLPLSPAMQDRLALARDWAAIGADMRLAIGMAPEREGRRVESAHVAQAVSRELTSAPGSIRASES